MANSASSFSNIVRPYSRYRGRMISQSDWLRNTYFLDSSCRMGRKPYSSPLHTTQSAPR